VFQNNRVNQKIEILSMQEQGACGFFRKKVVFKLKYSKYIDLSGDDLIFEYSVDSINCIGDSAIFSLLPLAFWERADIVVSEKIPVSNAIQTHVDAICSVWNRFFDVKRRINVLGGNRIELKADPLLKSGLLFSGGVDALASYIDKESEISHLLYCYGAILITQISLLLFRKKLMKWLILLERK